MFLILMKYVNGKLVTGNGSSIPISSLSNRSLLPSLTVPERICPYRDPAYVAIRSPEKVQEVKLQAYTITESEEKWKCTKH